MIAALLLGLSLAMDCFAIALSQGLRPNSGQNGHQHLLRLALLFGLFQGGMLLLGWAGGSLLVRVLGPYTDWLAALLLAGIGLKMLKESGESESEQESEQEPELQRWQDYLLLSIATSIDALAAGISLPSLKISVVLATAMVGFTSTGLALIGGFAGKKLGEKWGPQAEKFGGIVLLGLALKVLFF